MSKTMELEQKLEIMKRYIKETGKEIKYQTVFEGHNLGGMKNNLRQKDFKGELDISPELRKEFEAIGVLGERRRRVKASDYEKYLIIIRYLEGEKIDLPEEVVKEYMKWIQAKYNQNKLQLSQIEIEDLRKMGVLKASPKEKEDDADKYGITTKQARYIINRFGSIEEFIKRYKTGQIKVEELSRIYLRPRIMTISSVDIPAQRLSKILSLGIFSKLLRRDSIESGVFIHIDKLLLELEQLNDKERRIILNELKDKKHKKPKRELAKEMGVGANFPGERLQMITSRLAAHKGVIGYIERCEDENINKAYEKAYKHFMENENIFNPDEIIPASLERSRPNFEEENDKINKQNKDGEER